MKLIVEKVENVQYLTEEKNGQKHYFIEGVFLQAEQKNRNNRIYPVATLEREVNRYNTDYVKENRAFGELGHPDSPSINLDRVSHLIKDIRREGNDFIGKAKILDTPYGKIVKNLIDEGAKLGVSSRGMGTLVDTREGHKLVQDDFYLATAADIVADPSAPDAFVRGVMEGKEWVFVEGKIQEIDVNEYYDTIKRTRQKQLEEIGIRLFEDFMSKISKL